MEPCLVHQDDDAPNASKRYWDTVEALSPDDLSTVIRFGIRRESLKSLFGDVARRTPIAQYYGLVKPGLIIARHCFRGLNRNLLYDGNMRGDVDILAYTWRPVRDAQWEGPADG